ncbi:MAG: DUF1573 domain-containing protein [Bacteroidetes bacterium]|nr:DUF1573 domain-containing protein [Bacteroidota bacterium]
MKKYLCCLIFLYWVISIPTHGVVNENHVEPIITVSESIIDFGIANQGENLSRQIKVTNTGTRALKISNVRGSCGLAVVSFPRQEIKPGESGVIHFRYDSSRIGDFERILTIHSNSAENTVKIKVKGRVVNK